LPTSRSSAVEPYSRTVPATPVSRGALAVAIAAPVAALPSAQCPQPWPAPYSGE
jgi:hypothetical protein